jgi:hypothetical protein
MEDIEQLTTNSIENNLQIGKYLFTFAKEIRYL